MHWKKMPKTGHALDENGATQPRVAGRIFANHHVVTEGWYPLQKSKTLKKGSACSVTILKQRICLFRGTDNRVRAIDAFCPHLGADLGNGIVKNNSILCRLHGWEFCGDTDHSESCNRLQRTVEHGNRVDPRSYPVTERYGFIWVYAGERASHPLVNPPGISGPAKGRHLATVDLFTHHHVMVMGGVDLEHFRTIHGLDARFELQSVPIKEGVVDWQVRMFPTSGGVKAHMLRLIFTDGFCYRLRFAGGSVASITYGYRQQWRGLRRLFPGLHLVWGCVPLSRGVSRVSVFVVTSDRLGIIGWLKNVVLQMVSVILLAVLRDEDVQAFPNFRINLAHKSAFDPSIRGFVEQCEQFRPSIWTNIDSTEHATSARGGP